MTESELSMLLQDLVQLPGETEWVEFKENRAEPDDVGEYVSALANSAALHGKVRAYVVWGVRNGTHDVVGTNFRPGETRVGNEDLEPWISRLLFPRIDFRFFEGPVDGRRVVVLEIPAASHTPVRFKSDEFIRIGSYKKKLRDYPEKERVLWQTFSRIPFEQEVAVAGVRGDDVLQLIDHAAYFALTNLPEPKEPGAVLARLVDEKFIRSNGSDRYDVTNLGGIAFGRDLGRLGLGRKAVRVVVYRGSNRVETQRERAEELGYSAGFARLIEYVNAQLPTNEHIGRALRRVEPMYPELAIRELIANALVHQDLYMRGTGPMVEIFDDRVEITNPGTPLIDPARFIDQPPRSRNESLAALMRRFNVCEERGTGIDKVISVAEMYQLPAPDFQMSDLHTRVVLFAPRTLGEMSREDRIRACYQHAALQHVSNGRMTNTTLRERFKIAEKNYAMASRIIADTLDAGLIKPFDPTNRSRKHARYIPYWA